MRRKKVDSPKLEYEQKLLGCILNDDSCLANVQRIIHGKNDFDDTRHQVIYATIQALNNERSRVDFETVLIKLRDTKKIRSAGDIAYLTEVNESVTSAANVEVYAEHVANAARARQLRLLAKQLHQLSYYTDDGKTLPEILDAAENIAKEMQRVCSSGIASNDLVITCLADVESKQIQWLWRDRIPRGKLTNIVGNPGVGKSHLTLDIVARISNGLNWPDGRKALSGAGSIILLSAEDDVADTIRPRLEAAGADLQHIYILEAIKETGPKGKMRKRMFCLETDLAQLEKAIKRCRDVRLIVIDPISAYWRNTNTNSNAEVRSVLAPLSELAARHGVAVVAVTHFNKTTGLPAVYRTMGSLAFTAAARTVWCVVIDKDNPERRLFLPIKNNIAKDMTGLAFSIEDEPEHPGVAVVKWEPEPVTVPAEVALREESEWQPKKSAVDEAAAFLLEILAEGPLAVKDLKSAASENGHSWATIRRAKKQIGAESFRKGFGRESKCFWRLPNHRCSQNAIDAHIQNVNTYGKPEHLCTDGEESGGHGTHEESATIQRVGGENQANPERPEGWTSTNGSEM